MSVKAAIYLTVLFVLVNGLENYLEYNERSGKFYPFSIGLVRFENGACQSASNLTGTCYTRRQCQRLPGVASGTCARRVGVCCVVQRSCGATTSANNTYFVNPGFPNSYSGGNRCTITVQRCNSDICQLRVDFLSLILAQPDLRGHCINDALTITGAASPITPICGDNTGQHMYMDFNGDADISITIETSSAVTLSRNWNIKLTQIGCDCPTRAPSGCLQYYTALSGTVRSFNYGTTKNTINSMTGTREMANLNYGVCVAMTPDYCSIRWSQTSDSTSFTVSDDADNNLMSPQQGEVCTTDFVVIPNPIGETTDRFCGTQLTPKTTASKPFVLTVVTNDDDATDVANRGFALNYQQIRCSGTRL